MQEVGMGYWPRTDRKRRRTKNVLELNTVLNNTMEYEKFISIETGESLARLFQRI
jgi:hypothetical protein